MPELRALQIGPIAARCLARDGNGRVAAVFARSAYLELDPGLVVIGADDLPRGPLNVRTTALGAGERPFLGLRAGSPVRLDGGDLELGGGLSCSLAAAKVWHPATSTGAWRHASLSSALGTLERWAAARAPREGLGDVELVLRR